MANHSITITGISNGQPVLSDNGRTYVDPSDTVTWILGQNSGVTAITSIVDDVTTNVFDPNPAQVGGSTNWKGTINPLIAPGSEETYTINYTSGGTEHSFDPIIQVNPQM